MRPTASSSQRCSLAGAEPRIGTLASSARALSFSDAFLSSCKGLVFQVRAEGVSLSDRRVVKMLKLFAPSAYLDGREVTDASDFFVESRVSQLLEASFRSGRFAQI